MSLAGPYGPRHPARTTSSQTTPAPPPPSDPYYGHGETAQLCRRFICALFQCPDKLPPSNTQSPTPTLAHFIAYALHRTRLHSAVTFTALFLLSRLKSRFPAARGSSGHRLFISAFMISSKVVCDDTYSNKSWTVVGQGMFSLREINQMEREMCGYLEWLLNVDPEDLAQFETKVRRDYGPNGTCPSFYHPPLPAATQETEAVVPPMNVSPEPEETPHPAPAAPTSAPAPMTPPDSPRRAPLPPMSRAQTSHSKPRQPSLDTHISTPSLAKDTPSPASSQLCPRTPQSDDEADDPTSIVSPEYQDVSGDPTGMSRAGSALSMNSAASMQPKSKQGRDQSFAFPSRTVW